MVKNILIKYDIDEKLIEQQYYCIKFDYSKCLLLVSLESKTSDEFLESLNGKEILMQYRGISKMDQKKLFVIDLKQTNRNFKFDELGL